MLNGDFIKKLWQIKEVNGDISGPFNGFEMDIMNLTNSFKEGACIALKGTIFVPSIMYTLMSDYVINECAHFAKTQKINLISKKKAKEIKITNGNVRSTSNKVYVKE